MAVLSFTVLILIILAGYSSGAALIGGNAEDSKPRIIDLLIILLIGAGAVYSRLILAVNEWFLVALGLAVSHILAVVIVSSGKTPSKQNPGNIQLACTPGKPLKNIWITWRRHSRKTAAFQSRVMLSFFYFFFLTPIGLIMWIFSDPLDIKQPKQSATDSFWLSKKARDAEIDDFRRQF